MEDFFAFPDVDAVECAEVDPLCVVDFVAGLELDGDAVSEKANAQNSAAIPAVLSIRLSDFARLPISLAHATILPTKKRAQRPLRNDPRLGITSPVTVGQ